MSVLKFDVEMELEKMQVRVDQLSIGLEHKVREAVEGIRYPSDATSNFFLELRYVFLGCVVVVLVLLLACRMWSLDHYTTVHDVHQH